MTRRKSGDPEIGRGRHALVIGYGRSGRAAASFIKQRGGIVRVVDRADTPELRGELERAGLSGRLGGYGPEDLNGTDLVVVSPGVPWDAPLLETATALSAEVLRAGGLQVLRGGNIGEPVLDRIEQLRADDWVVLELSSFQLESIERPRLQVGVVLNVTPDHLDRHKTFEHYVELKTRAVAFMEADDHAVLNVDDPACAAMQSKTRGQVIGFGLDRPVANGVTLEQGWIVIAGAGAHQRVLPAADVPLPGDHNLSNVMAAIGVGYSVGVEPETMGQAVRRFKAVEHRLEPIGTFAGARWYNDSKATNPDSTYKALAAFRDPIVLIAGGRNKGIDLEPLAQAIAARAVALVTIGETGEELAQRVRAAGLHEVQPASDLTDAVRKAAALAKPGTVVLLSPAFTSFDMFRDYEDRGRRFKATVVAELGR